MSEASEANLGRETLGATAAKIVMAIGGFVGTIIFAKELGPTTFGGVYLLLAVTKILDRPMNGWALAGMKRVSEAQRLRGDAFGAQVLFNLGWTAIVSVGALFFAQQLIDYTKLELAPVLLVLLLTSESMFETLYRLVEARARISAAAWVDTVRSYLTLPLQLAFVFFGFGGAGMIFGLASASILVLPIIGYFIGAFPVWPSFQLLRSYASYARYSIPMSILGNIYDRLDILLLGIVMSPAVAGYYEVAWKVTMPAAFIADSIGSGLMAKVSSLSAQDRDPTQEVINAVSFSSIVAIPLFVGAILLSQEVILTFYGAEYSDATILLIGLAGYHVIRAQSIPVGRVVNGLDRPDVSMRLTAIAVTVNVIVGISLTLHIGAIGVVIGTILAELIRYVGSVLLLRQELTEFTPLPRPIFKQFGAALIMGVFVQFAHTQLPVRTVVDLIVLTGFGGLVYSVVILVLSEQLRITVQSILNESRLTQFR